MPSLLDHIDRFSFTAQEIQNTTRRTASVPQGPFSRAVLKTELGDLAREIDASEMGLFTLVPPPATHVQAHEKDAPNGPNTEIKRVEFLGATPLRKPAGKSKEVQVEKQPEVYAEAALKYLDRFQSIRAMPRARQEIVSIIQQLDALRGSIEMCQETLEQHARAGPSSPKSAANEEERRIRELQTRIKQLKARREVLAKEERNPNHPPSRTQQSPPSAKRGQAKKKLVKGNTAPKPDEHEEHFWATSSNSQPKFKGRASFVLPADSTGDDSMLMDSEMNLGDLTTTSSIGLPSPISQPRVVHQTSKAVDTLRQIVSPSEPLDGSDSRKDVEVGVVEKPGDDGQAEGSDEEGEGEKTIVLKQIPNLLATTTSLPPSQSDTNPPMSPKSSASEKSGPEPATPMTHLGNNESMMPGTGKKSRIRVTSETERIVAKIWSCVGDVLMLAPRSKNIPDTPGGNKHPRAKETIALLQTLSSQMPSPSSPSTHSTLSLTTEPRIGSSSQPTAHQILTGLLLLTLLSLPPTYSIPLTKLKEILTSKGISSQGGPGIGIVGQGPETRALYGCVAKRLVKIDRSGREQIVRFDI
ncbi:hypothetical protein BD410DRAFT_566984 [Rickenella mellea]|uniref:Uncharacterized protein n=1 Tax=Rickenella mellea TaxID=50990 RepID=A0A4Y7QFJ3_9AGAM|nr:hypothetical protein BD410DRAFT_566984 [Rickenella mellea]